METKDRIAELRLLIDMEKRSLERQIKKAWTILLLSAVLLLISGAIAVAIIWTS